MGIGVNRQDYDCPNVTNAGEVGTPESTIDACYEREPGGSLPMTLALGVRVVPPLRGISAVLGIELGLSGTSTFARELGRVAVPRALRVLVRLRCTPRREGDRPAPPAAPAPAPGITGRIQGRVTGSDGSPIDSAIVAFVAHDVSAVATSSDGRFVSEAFPPGEVQLEASHPDYETARCAAVIPEGGGNVEASCELTPKPSTAKLTGRVLDVFGAPQSGASVSLQGPTSGSATTDMRGSFEIAGVTSGEYTVRVDAPGHFTKLVKTTVGEDSQSQLEIAVLARPASPTVSLSGNEIRARDLKFQGTSTELDRAAAQSVAELADLLLSRPDLRVQIQGYGDDALSLSRSLLVKQRLVDAGVPDGRLAAIGGGQGRMLILVVQ